MIPALVLTAGLATRLRPLSLLRAKAALPVAGEPLVRRVLRQLAASNVTDAVLNLHHLPHTITGIVGDGSDLGVRVRYSWENPVLGPAGGPRRALRIIGRSPFLVVNGDTLCDVDLQALVAAHQASDAVLTMAVVAQEAPEKYGSVAADEAGVVTGLVPPGPAHLRTALFHFVGIYIATAEAFAHIPENRASDFREVVAAHLGRIRVHVQPKADFLDIGTCADYLATSLLLARREGRSTHATSARIEPGAQVIDSVLWDNVIVEGGAHLRECIVCDGVVVPADTSWHGVTLRQASGELAPGEKRIESLYVASL